MNMINIECMNGGGSNHTCNRGGGVMGGANFSEGRGGGFKGFLGYLMNMLIFMQADLCLADAFKAG